MHTLIAWLFPRRILRYGFKWTQSCCLICDNSTYKVHRALVNGATFRGRKRVRSLPPVPLLSVAEPFSLVSRLVERSGDEGRGEE